jgi:hypothetical protein
MRYTWLMMASLALATGCGSKEEKSGDDSSKTTTTDSASDSAMAADWAPLEQQLMESGDIDLKMDVSGFALWQLRILRNVIPARQGYLFMESDLRAWFGQTKWYNKAMEDRWYGECEESGLPKKPPIAYSSDEAAFMERCKLREEQLRKEHYAEVDGKKQVNLNNVVNIWQFSELDPGMKDRLRQNQFVMLPGENVQFFQLYEENDYSQTQNFISTDMMLHLGHIHTSFLVRDIEEEHLFTLVTNMQKNIALHLKTQVAAHPELKAELEYLQAFFAVGAAVGGANLDGLCPASYLDKARKEVKLIQAQKDEFSALMPSYQGITFPYSMFKPRGHYTRSEELKKYFMMVQWMQWASFCLREDDELKQAVVAALILQNNDIRNAYEEYMEITGFFFGMPDNVSAKDLYVMCADAGVTMENPDGSKVKEKAIALSKKKNVITPKVKLGCEEKMNFLPARYMFDNEVLQDMAWVKAGGSTERPYAKGLDVFAALGDKTAEKILVEEYEEDKKWKDFMPNLRNLQKKFASFADWDATVYNKTMQVLKQNLWVDKRAPEFMRSEQWKRKNLNASLAAWAELKHDAVLYAEQPFAAECGGGEMCTPPPNAIVRSYVEPNTEVYLKMTELLDKSVEIVDRIPGVRDTWKGRTEDLRNYTQFLLDIARKELDGRSLTDEEYGKLEIIGSTLEWMTVQMMGLWEWASVQGADKEVALVADVYTNNSDKKRAGILHVATGNVFELYVIVEINGDLYLTRGGSFSYYEFVQPLDKRLTDEEWQEMLKNKKAPAMPEWMDAILVPGIVKPEVKEVVYSSGC